MRYIQYVTCSENKEQYFSRSDSCNDFFIDSVSIREVGKVTVIN